jgi:hypothetical protein
MSDGPRNLDNELFLKSGGEAFLRLSTVEATMSSLKASLLPSGRSQEQPRAHSHLVLSEEVILLEKEFAHAAGH